MADQNIPVTADGAVLIDCDNNNDGTTNVIKFTHNNGTELMRIQENGNVGISTTSPGAKLHVKTDGDVAAIFEDDDNPFILLKDANAGVDLKYAGVHLNNNKLSLGKTNDTIASFTDYLTVDTSNGNVGIGTMSPAEKLDVSGSILLSGALKFDDSNYKIDGGSSNSFLRIYTNGLERIHIGSDGNVGISDIEPDEKLSVNGNIRTQTIILQNIASHPDPATTGQIHFDGTYLYYYNSYSQWKKIATV